MLSIAHHLVYDSKCGQEPEKPTDWALPEETVPIYSNSCDECSKLDEFLRDPETKGYAVSAKDD